MMPTASGIPTRSPITVLTRPAGALLRGADETRYVRRGMAVDTVNSTKTRKHPVSLSLSLSLCQTLFCQPTASTDHLRTHYIFIFNIHSIFIQHLSNIYPTFIHNTPHTLQPECVSTPTTLSTTIPKATLSLVHHVPESSPVPVRVAAFNRQSS